MAHERALARNAMFGAVVVAVIAALLLVRSSPEPHHRAAPYAQLENKEGLFPPPPARPKDDTRYTYTPSSADGDASAASAAPPSPPATDGVDETDPVSVFVPGIIEEPPHVRRGGDAFAQCANHVRS